MWAAVVAALCVCVCAVRAEVRYYDAFSGAELSAEELAAKEALGADSAFWCINAIETCSETEGRRSDGSCNNLATPTAGAAHQPFERLLPARYAADGLSTVPKSDGSALPAERAVRTALLASGTALGDHFSQLSMLFNTFISTDFTPVTVLDIVNYVALHPKCCTADAASDYMCSALSVPTTDTLTRLRGVTCLNHTRPIEFQSKQCISADVTPPERINYGSAHLDLKPVYGVHGATSVRQRLFSGGRFNYTAASDGLTWPVYINDAVNTRDGLAGVGGTNFFMALMFWREHNRIAQELETLNPQWSDEKLFQTARDINIAQYSQMFFYENLPDLFGYENLIRDGVISTSEGHRDLYSASELPGWWHESLYVHRWFHTIQNGNVELINTDGVKQGDFAASLTIPISMFNSGNNLSYFAQGCYRTNSAKGDNMIDPFLGETALWPASTQVAGDVASIDLAKGRLLGLAPYVDYLELCDGNTVEDWDQLEDYLDEEARSVLREVYGSDVRDVELLAALWRENNADGAQVPKTLYCLAVKQLIRNIQTDRHWYERESRPNAFNSEQLAEIRKANIARILCDNTADITTSGITLHALRPLSTENPIVSCSSIPRVDLSLWTDTSTE